MVTGNFASLLIRNCLLMSFENVRRSLSMSWRSMVNKPVLCSFANARTVSRFSFHHSHPQSGLSLFLQRLCLFICFFIVSAVTGTGRNRKQHCFWFRHLRNEVLNCLLSSGFWLLTFSRFTFSVFRMWCSCNSSYSYFLITTHPYRCDNLLNPSLSFLWIR